MELAAYLKYHGSICKLDDKYTSQYTGQSSIYCLSFGRVIFALCDSVFLLIQEGSKIR